MDRSHISAKSDEQIKRLLKLLGGIPYRLLTWDLISKQEFDRYTRRYGN